MNILTFSFSTIQPLRTLSYTKVIFYRLTEIVGNSGNKTIAEYTPAGDMMSITNPLGHTTTFTYDENGNTLTETEIHTTSSGPETVTRTYEYDTHNRVIKVIDPAGNSTITEYDAIGQIRATIDKLGNRIENAYDPRGKLLRKIYPDGTEERHTYDAAGRDLSTTDRLGRTTRYEYDKVGRIVKIIASDSSYTQFVYDEIEDKTW